MFVLLYTFRRLAWRSLSSNIFGPQSYNKIMETYMVFCFWNIPCIGSYVGSVLKVEKLLKQKRIFRRKAMDMLVLKGGVGPREAREALPEWAHPSTHVGPLK